MATGRSRWWPAMGLLVGVAGAIALIGALGSDPPQHAPSPAYHGATVRDAGQQAGLVTAEDHRLDEVRAVTAVAPQQGPTWNKPYRLSTGSGYTLVLTRRHAPYTIADLLTLAPQTFVRQQDGSYLLAENVYVSVGAKLLLSNPGGLTLHLASNDDGFVTIVSFGGTLGIEGTAQNPMRIDAWNPRTNSPDTTVSDGRAYVRAIGGQFSMAYVHASDLGFWSGRTGGISLTGTDRPDTGSTVATPTHLTKSQRHAAKKQRLTGPAKPTHAPSAGDLYAAPAGPLGTPDRRYDVPAQSYVSATVSDSSIDGDAFGLFVSSANGVQISDTVVRHSTVDGVVLHRFASNAVISRTRSDDNAGDGFVLARATEQVQITAATADHNGGDGFRLTGQALAAGPSASGQSTTTYGHNSVSTSDAADNGRYGIEVIGGSDIGVQNNRVLGSEMGIVVRQGARHVSIVGNQLSRQRAQGISVRDGVTGGTVAGNLVRRSPTGIYLRDSVVEVRSNTIQDASSHGVALVGRTGGSVVSYNTMAGIGPSAVDTGRSHGSVRRSGNQTFGWQDTTSLWRKFRSKASPTTVLWVCVILLALVTGVAARRRGRGRRPYDHQMSLKARRPSFGARAAQEFEAGRSQGGGAAG